MTNRITKQESSIPVQTRVSIVSLAELAKYWRTTEYDIKSMSQLVSWSLDLLRDILKSNKLMPEEIESVIEARNYLIDEHLWQKRVSERAFTKIGNAVRFQGFRGLGEDPETRDGRSKVNYNMMHNKHSVDPYEDKVSVRKKELEGLKDEYFRLFGSDEEPRKLGQEEVRARYRRQQKVYREKVELERSRKVENSAAAEDVTVKEGMSDEEYEGKLGEIVKRDEKRVELEKSAEISGDNIVEEER